MQSVRLRTASSNLAHSGDVHALAAQALAEGSVNCGDSEWEWTWTVLKAIRGLLTGSIGDAVAECLAEPERLKVWAA
jgi:hypothetical protein